MNNPIDEKAQLDVEISNLYATDAEIAAFTNMLVQGLGSKATTPMIRSVGVNAKGTRYEVTFKVLEPRHFSINKVRDWLHAAMLVGWNLDTTIVPPQ